MPKLLFTQQEIDSYAREDGYKHHYYDKCRKRADEMGVHADGCYPECLLGERRPNEPIEVKDYRKKIWVPITKPVFSKVFTSLQKIRRSSDWSIKYEDLEQFTRIMDGESLEDYCEKEFPYFTSLTNWTFQVLLRKYLIDPNSVCAVWPLEIPVDNSFLKPFATIFDSCHVIDYEEEDYAVLLNPVGCYYTTETNYREKGRSFYILTTQNIWRYDQIDSKGNFKLTFDYPHGLDMLPAFQLGGMMIEHVQSRFFYESRIAGMLPEMDEAVREYSDLQAAKVLHIYPERWEFTQNECTHCKGTGVRPNPLFTPDCNCEPTIVCGHCVNGYVVSGPYSKIMVRPTSAMEGQQPIPNPPAGYIQKDVDIVKIQEDSVYRHLFNALASINFEFLAAAPLAQSGIAKNMDRDEANNTTNSIAEDIVSDMDKLYKIIGYYRYQALYSHDDIDMMVPKISVPEKFDLITAMQASEELKVAKDNKSNPVIINSMEIDYANRKFSTDPEVRDMLTLILELDPLAGVNEDDKMIRLANKGITQDTYIISANIQEFVQRALEEDDNFPSLTLTEQKAVMQKYAQVIIDAQSAAKQILADANIFSNTGQNNQSGTAVSANNSGIPAGYAGQPAGATAAP